MGREVVSTIYLPEDVPLTRERREKADKLDQILKTEIEKINKSFDKLDDSEMKIKEIKKWRWLGKQIDNLLKGINLIEKTDIDNHIIWPAIGQYLKGELKRGFDDVKRSGTKNDHYRKCWALASITGADWIDSWVGWDAFTDRGDQLVYNKKLMPIMSVRFLDITPAIKSKEYQLIAKLLIKRIPTKAKTPSNIDAMSEKELERIADSVYREFVSLRNTGVEKTSRENG